MILSELIRDIPLEIPSNADLTADISSLCHDSRAAGENCIFVCIRGAIADGHRYAPAAYEAGCRHFVAEHSLPDLPADATVLISPNPRIALALLSARFFDYPAKQLTVIGITGTKGKTSTALMISNVLNSCGLSCGYIGSNGVRYGSFRGETANTTPESYDLHMFMREMVNVGVKYLAIEVSSQALHMYRVHGITFDICLFTNLSEDHIGEHEHPTFEHYKNCKRSLFHNYGAKAVIFNADDPYAAEMIAGLAKDVTLAGYSIDTPSPLQARDLKLFRDEEMLGIQFDCLCDGQAFPMLLGTPGKFSVYNALACISVCRMCGIDMERITQKLRTVRINGRFECVNALPYATFIIDYAHNRVSLTSALETLRLYEPHRLICLFGSVGGRTRGRRVEMGSVAAGLCDFCILTADNPDFEDPQAIIDEIATQFRFGGCAFVGIPDRAEAIRYAVNMAEPGDIFLLAGKGHEDYQLILGKKIPFSEREILTEAAAELLQTPSV